MFLHGFGTTLLEGAWMTVRLAAATLALGVALGLIGAGAKLSPIRAFQKIAGAYTTIVRGVPELLVIFLIYFGGTALLSRLMNDYVEVSAFWAGVCSLGFIFGAYATETLRGAFLAIARGHVEAARAFGMSGWQTFRRIQLPQVWRYALPGLGNLWLVLLKDTALVSIVGLEDIMRKAQIAVGYTKEAFTFYLAAAVIYLALTSVSMVALHHMERHLRRGERQAA